MEHLLLLIIILPWKLLFFFLLSFGTFIASSASSWLAAWIGLEINILAFLGLSLSGSSPRNSEAILKYFLVQALASAVLIAAALTSYFSYHFILSSALILSLILKLGGAPFHFWVPLVLGGTSWDNLFFILSWQKIAPFFLLFSIPLTNIFFTILILSSGISAILGALGGLRINSTRKLLAFSSINHIGWILPTIAFNLKKWLIYFLPYALILSTLIILLNFYNFSTLALTPSLSSLRKLNIFVTLFSFGGLPPLFGFLPKWTIINSLAREMPAITVILVIRRLITLFFYLRLGFNSFLISSSLINKHPKITLAPAIVNLLGLSLISIT